MQDHPSEEHLAEYALDPSLAGAAEELAAHLDRCAPCRERLAGIRSFDGLLAEEESWTAVEELGPPPAAPPALSAAAARNLREDAEADARLSGLIDTFVDGSSGAFGVGGHRVAARVLHGRRGPEARGRGGPRLV